VRLDDFIIGSESYLNRLQIQRLKKVEFIEAIVSTKAHAFELTSSLENCLANTKSPTGIHS
jgi:hypothetical protein